MLRSRRKDGPPPVVKQMKYLTLATLSIFPFVSNIAMLCRIGVVFHGTYKFIPIARFLLISSENPMNSRFHIRGLGMSPGGPAEAAPLPPLAPFFFLSAASGAARPAGGVPSLSRFQILINKSSCRACNFFSNGEALNSRHNFSRIKCRSLEGSAMRGVGRD